MKFRQALARALFRASMAGIVMGCSVASWVLFRDPWMIHVH